MTMTATPLVVNYNSFGGATGERNFFEIQPNGQFGYDYNPSTLSFASGAVADELGLTQASDALDSSPGGALQSASVFMNNLVQNEYSQFGSYQATWETLAQLDPQYLGDLAAWAPSTGDLYTFLNQWTNTTSPAGSSLPTTDPAGTYSGPGASAPTIDPPGTYSGPGASAPTLAQPATMSRPPGPAARRWTIPAITRRCPARRRRSWRCRRPYRARSRGSPPRPCSLTRRLLRRSLPIPTSTRQTAFRSS